MERVAVTDEERPPGSKGGRPSEPEPKAPERYDTLPEGWRRVKGATTAPVGWYWANNGKGLFSKEYEHGLVREHGEG